MATLKNRFESHLVSGSISILFCLGFSVVCAEDGLGAEPPIELQPSSGPYCGIYSSCRAIQILGKDAKTSDYATKDYVSHPLGSTQDDIIRLCKINGFRAIGFRGLSKLDVYALGIPIIANVRRDAVSNEFDHWVCLLVSHGDLLLFDNLENGRKISFAELAAIWNGYGIVVSKNSVAIPFVFARISVLAIIIWFCWYVSKKLSLKSSRLRSFSNWPIAILSLAVAIVFVFGDVGHHAYATRTSVEPFSSQLFEEATLADLQFPPKDTLLIDARLRKDFENGSVNGSLNLPVSSTTLSIVDSLHDYSLDKPLLVFCQSHLCPYAEIIARRLRVVGFTKVRVCKMGWRELMEGKAEGAHH